jgi:hypothetical protein
MVITRITGGLGNQMFQYAAGRAASLRNQTEFMLDTAFYDVAFSKQIHEQQAAINLFPRIKAMSLASVDREFLADMRVESNGFIMRSYNRIGQLFGFKPIYKHIEEKNLLSYQPSFHTENAVILYLGSDWQNEKYFAEYKAVIKNDFTFPGLDDSINSSILGDIQQTNSVSVHVRRGDYLSSATHQPTSADYYKNAVEMMTKKVSNPTYFIFSDDINWCKENLNLPMAQYISHNTGVRSYIDMQLMSYCKHNIIANSSFSWWGAWLNNNSDKVIIAPEIWLQKFDIKSKELIPNDWITIK